MTDRVGWHDGNGNRAAAASPEDRLRSHLRAIFAFPCTCYQHACPKCREATKAYGGNSDDPDPCVVHEASCQACIAEHALYLDGYHADARDG
jgi:hypothetical protein